ncbi:GNAT family N-acetyltransferase [Streptomyces boninensis]|uniref:GNAT family N-acetyltransferase n=1 Tax=Streptomyces boninensis TaxID=2039455 RepID=UPI003B2158F3
MTAVPSATLTTWYLEQTAPEDLVPPSGGQQPMIMRAEVPSPELNRFLYVAVGSDIAWTDRLVWPPEQWREFVEAPATETWIAYDRGTPAGYVEMRGQADGVIEITQFGLIPAFRGRGLGGSLLAYGVARAWDLAERWPGRERTRRVWLHTCSDDGEHALANYEKRGFRVYDTTVEERSA